MQVQQCREAQSVVCEIKVQKFNLDLVRASDVEKENGDFLLPKILILPAGQMHRVSINCYNKQNKFFKARGDEIDTIIKTVQEFVHVSRSLKTVRDMKDVVFPTRYCEEIIESIMYHMQLIQQDMKLCPTKQSIC